MHPLPNLSSAQIQASSAGCSSNQIPTFPQIITTTAAANVPSSAAATTAPNVRVRPFMNQNRNNSMFVPVPVPMTHMNINGNPNTINNINIGYPPTTTITTCNYGHVQSFPSPTLTFQSDPTPIMPMINNHSHHQMVQYQPPNAVAANNANYYHSMQQTQHAQKQNLINMQQQYYNNNSLPKFPQIPTFSAGATLSTSPNCNNKNNEKIIEKKDKKSMKKARVNIPRFLIQNKGNKQLQSDSNKYEYLFVFKQKKVINENVIFSIDEKAMKKVEKLKQKSDSTLTSSLRPSHVTNNAFF